MHACLPNNFCYSRSSEDIRNDILRIKSFSFVAKEGYLYEEGSSFIKMFSETKTNNSTNYCKLYITGESTSGSQRGITVPGQAVSHEKILATVVVIVTKNSGQEDGTIQRTTLYTQRIKLLLRLLQELFIATTRFLNVSTLTQEKYKVAL